MRVLKQFIFGETTTPQSGVRERRRLTEDAPTPNVYFWAAAWSDIPSPTFVRYVVVALLFLLRFGTGDTSREARMFLLLRAIYARRLIFALREQ